VKETHETMGSRTGAAEAKETHEMMGVWTGPARETQETKETREMKEGFWCKLWFPRHTLISHKYSQGHMKDMKGESKEQTR